LGPAAIASATAARPPGAVVPRFAPVPEYDARTTLSQAAAVVTASFSPASGAEESKITPVAPRLRISIRNCRPYVE
jgi:hypothetical protein